MVVVDIHASFNQVTARRASMVLLFVHFFELLWG